MWKNTIRVSLIFVILTFVLSSLAIAGTWIDDFNDGDLAGWRMLVCFWRDRIVVLDEGNWFFENGAIVGGDDNQGKRYDLYTGDMSWTDYIVEVSVKLSKRLEDCPEDTGVWLIARSQEGEGKIGLNGYVVGMIIWHGFQVLRGGFKYVNGFDSNNQILALPSEANRWYRLKINVEKDLITGFVDDVKVYELRDGTFTSGLVGIAVNGVKATFDDLMVTGPNIPDGGPGHSVNPSRSSVTTWANIKRSASK